MEPIKIGKAVFAKTLTPEERMEWVEKHDSYPSSELQDAIRKSEMEVYHVSIFM